MFTDITDPVTAQAPTPSTAKKKEETKYIRKVFETTQISVPKICVENEGYSFYSTTYSTLSLYGTDQVKLYGMKNCLINRLEDYYKIELGKNVRVLGGNIILFFPSKIGLFGKMGQTEWTALFGDFELACCMLCICPTGFTDFGPHYDRFVQSLGMIDDGHGYYRPDNSDTLPLYLYHHERLYWAESITLSGNIHLHPLTDFKIIR